MEKPFYFKKNAVGIYVDRIEFSDATIYFSDVVNIHFGRIDFGTSNNISTTFELKNGEILNFLLPPSAYFSLKNFREKGIKSDGKKEALLFAFRFTALFFIISVIIYFLVNFVF